MDEHLEFSISLNVNESLESMVAKGVEAERGGIDQVWIGDHPGQRYPAIIAGLMAENTSRITVGLGPLSPIVYPAEHIASMLVVLFEAYGMRFDLCLVPGDRSRVETVKRKYAKDIDLEMLKSLEVIRNTLKKEGVDARIWLGAQGPKMLKISTKFDGALINLSYPDMIRKVVGESSIKQCAKHDFKIGIFFPSYVYRRHDPSIQSEAERAAIRVMLGASKAFKRKYGFEKLSEASSRSIENKNMEESIRRFYLSLSAEKLRRYVEEIREVGVSHFAFAYPQNLSVELVRDLSYALTFIK